MDSVFPHAEIRLHCHETGMKIYGLIILAALISTAPIMHGQEAAPPSVDLYQGQTPPEAADTPSPGPSGPDLPEISQLDQTFSKPKSLGKDADALRVHIEWRQLKNRVVNDPAVQTAKKYALAARTDLERRKRLSAYYDIYYERMAALATTPEIKVALQVYKATHQYVLAQPRVRPSPIPEGATPTPTPSGTPAPKKPAHKHKKKGQKWHLGAALPPAFNIVFLQASRFYGAFV